jgi:hypothetical protein
MTGSQHIQKNVIKLLGYQKGRQSERILRQNPHHASLEDTNSKQFNSSLVLTSFKKLSKRQFQFPNSQTDTKIRLSEILVLLQSVKNVWTPAYTPGDGQTS